jgi:hypothetical protein
MADVSAASEFVMAYYTHLAYQPSDLPKFYDQDNARVWRSSLPSNIGVPFSTLGPQFIPDIPEGSSVTVLNYNVLPLETGLAVVVHGSLVCESFAKLFDQFFTLEQVADRFFITGDSLTLIEAPRDSDLLKGDGDYVSVPSRKNGGRGKGGGRRGPNENPQNHGPKPQSGGPPRGPERPKQQRQQPPRPGSAGQKPDPYYFKPG